MDFGRATNPIPLLRMVLSGNNSLTWFGAIYIYVYFTDGHPELPYILTVDLIAGTTPSPREFILI